MPDMPSKRSRIKSVTPMSTKRKVVIGGSLVALLAVVLVGGLAWDNHRISSAPASGIEAYTPAPPVSATGLPALTIPANPRVLFIGDSFTEGHGALNKKTNGFPPRLAALEGWTDIRVDGVGLTGFMRPGVNDEAHRTYGERIQRWREDGKFQPDLIIFQGGLNDHRYGSGELQQSVQDTLKMTKGFWPDAQLVLIGPITYRTSLSAVNGAYSQGAYVAGVPYVDANRFPIIPQADNLNLTIEDHWHPNDAGHQLVAETLVTRFQELAPTSG